VVIKVLIFISMMIIAIGLIFKLFPPKKINNFYGYRTTISMKNQTSWDYAQKIGAFGFIIVGLFLNLLGFIFLLLNFNNEILEMIIFITSMIMMLITDEMMLRKYLKKKH
jgi:uncharacterized membrane protein